MPEAPIGVPDAFDEHVKLMFDLQALAFASDVTRVFSFKMGRDGSSRAYPESGVKTGFHPASHHQEKEERIQDFAKINKYHVSMVPYFLEKLKNTPDGDGSLLDHTLIVYGSPMGDSNVHNHKRCPLFLAGHASGKLPGQYARASGRRHPDGERHVDRSPLARLRGQDVVRRQHRRPRSGERAEDVTLGFHCTKFLSELCGRCG